MKKLDKRMIVGTRVYLEDLKGKQIVKSVRKDRLGFEVENYQGTWQQGHVVKFRNN